MLAPMLTAILTAAPPVVVRADEPAVLPASAQHLGGPFYRVRDVPVAQLRARAGVRWADEDVRRRVTLDQLDPAEALQWHLDNDGSRTDVWPRIEAGADINAPDAWAVTEGSDQVVIAVLDGGFPADHPDLPDTSRLPGWDFVDDDADTSPVGADSLAAHGTAVAALALGVRNGAGVVGVCPRCRLLPVRMLAADSTARDGDLVASILWAAERADVINASWSYDERTYVPRAIHEAIRWAAENGRDGRGCVVVFSAGNRSRDIDPFTPEAMVETLTVGATDERDQRAGYSNRGSYLSLVAPGGLVDEWVEGERVPRAKLVTADLEGDAGNNPDRDLQHAPGIVDDLAVTASFRGTSAATPLVAGAAGLLLSAKPNLFGVQASWILTETAAEVGGVIYVDGHNDGYGHGRLDVGAAMAMALTGEHCVPEDESCDNDVDDDCDRLVDEDDPDCGAERPRVFELPLVACVPGGDCGDGYCGVADGDANVTLCTAECDFDCPADGACVGPEGGGQCVPICASSDDCPSGTACAVPGVGLVPPGQEPRSACLPTCTENSDCNTAFCVEGACAGDAPEWIPEPPPPDDGCAAVPGLSLVALLLLRRRR